MKIMEMIARDEITWKRDAFWGYDVPVEVPGMDVGRFDLSHFYSDEEVRQMSAALRQERLQWLAKFPGLAPEIVGAVKG